jgi:hypothetical protein
MSHSVSLFVCAEADLVLSSIKRLSATNCTRKETDC